MVIPKKQTPIVLVFLRWYYTEAPRAICHTAMTYIVAIAEIFPFVFLLKTLVSPWKNIVDRTVMHGIDLNLIAEKLSLGLLARLVGFVVRILTIAAGLIIEIIAMATTVVLLMMWLTFPLLFLLGISFSLRLV